MPQHDEETETHRRLEDRDKMLHTRLDEIEKEYRNLVTTVGQLAGSLAVVKLEQTHLKELFAARLSTIEESGKLQMAKLEQISTAINVMGSEVDRTPMGRQLQSQVDSAKMSIDACNNKLSEHAQWQDRVDGVLAVMKWVGAGGLVALGITILRILKLLP